MEYDETVGKMTTGKLYTANENDTDEPMNVKTAGQKRREHIHFVVTVKMCVSEEMIFVNGYNCFLLRGLAENKVLLGLMLTMTKKRTPF